MLQSLCHCTNRGRQSDPETHFPSEDTWVRTMQNSMGNYSVSSLNESDLCKIKTQRKVRSSFPSAAMDTLQDLWQIFFFFLISAKTEQGITTLAQTMCSSFSPRTLSLFCSLPAKPFPGPANSRSSTVWEWSYFLCQTPHCFSQIAAGLHVAILPPLRPQDSS